MLAPRGMVKPTSCVVFCRVAIPSRWHAHTYGGPRITPGYGDLRGYGALERVPGVAHDLIPQPGGRPEASEDIACYRPTKKSGTARRSRTRHPKPPRPNPNLPPSRTPRRSRAAHPTSSGAPVGRAITARVEL